MRSATATLRGEKEEYAECQARWGTIWKVALANTSVESPWRLVLCRFMKDGWGIPVPLRLLTVEAMLLPVMKATKDPREQLLGCGYFRSS